MRRPSAILILAFATASCGGGSEDGSVSTSVGGTFAGTVVSSTEPETPAEEEDSGSSPGTTAAPQTDSGDLSGIGEASVSLGGETYLFGETSFPALRCEIDMLGLFWVGLGMVDESGAEVPDGGSVGLVLLHEGTDPVEVDQVPTAFLNISASDQEWAADPADLETFTELEPGTSQVDSYTIDGNTVSGSATFYERNSYYAFVGGSADAIDVAQGTFEATCAG